VITLAKTPNVCGRIIPTTASDGTDMTAYGRQHIVNSGSDDMRVVESREG